MPESSDRGALTEAVFYILLTLHKPMHGYGIMQFVRDVSKDRVNLGPGTLYGAINTLLQKGWIQAICSDADSRKKEYLITSTGRKAVQDELQRLDELLETGRRLAGGDAR
jgi:DNA-binding PadR family transcriptional regulator